MILQVFKIVGTTLSIDEAEKLIKELNETVKGQEEE
jgi:hypothetical protein